MSTMSWKLTHNADSWGNRRSALDVSNEAGVYRFDAVDPGVSNVTVSHPDFRKYSGLSITVEANRVTTVDPRLEVGAAETKIEVNGESDRAADEGWPVTRW